MGTEALRVDWADCRGAGVHRAEEGIGGALGAGLIAAKEGGAGARAGAGAGGGALLRDPASPALQAGSPPSESPTPTCTASRLGLQGGCLWFVSPSALPAFQKLPRHALARPPSLRNRALPEVSGDCGASACLAV